MFTVYACRQGVLEPTPGGGVKDPSGETGEGVGGGGLLCSVDSRKRGGTSTERHVSREERGGDGGGMRGGRWGE